MPEITFNIEKTICELSKNPRGWSKEVNLVSWNGYPAKFDIREWAPDHSRMGKGITLSDEEMQTLVEKVSQMLDTEPLPET